MRTITTRRDTDWFDRLTALFVVSWFTFFLAWMAVKIPAFIILVVNIGYVITAHNNDALATFDYFWLIVSGIATIVL